MCSKASGYPDIRRIILLNSSQAPQSREELKLYNNAVWVDMINSITIDILIINYNTNLLQPLEVNYLII